MKMPATQAEKQGSTGGESRMPVKANINNSWGLNGLMWTNKLYYIS